MRRRVRSWPCAHGAAVFRDPNHRAILAEHLRLEIGERIVLLHQADELITQRLKEALALVDIRLLDHFVIGGPHAFSFSERGLL